MADAGSIGETISPMDYMELRESTGLNRKEFCEKFEIPYRTMTEWELGHRNAPPYVLRLLSYYVEMQRKLNENGISEK